MTEPPARSLAETASSPPGLPSPRHRLYLVVSLVVSGILIVFAVQGVDWAQMVAGLRSAQPRELGAAFALVTLSFVLRGLRWGILLSAERSVNLVVLFWAISAGYLGNYFLPARAGELIRSLALAQKTAINASYILATAFIERIFDALVLVIISVAVLSTLHDVPETLVIATRTMAVVGLLGVLGILIAPRLERPIARVLGWLHLPPSLHKRLWTLVAQFLLGMRACQNPRRALGFAAITVLAWTIDIVMAVTVGQALGLPLTLIESILLLAMLGLSSAIPSTPGYIGVYQFVAVVVLTRYDYARHEALTYILVFQAISYLAALIYGLVGVWQLNARQLLTWQHRTRVD